jgi:hypothetical protein
MTAICDNIALMTNHLYNLNWETKRISLSTGSGDDFLKEIKSKNPNLKSHIDTHRSFINLIYKFREKVIHQEGLDQRLIGIVPNYNNFIQIDSDTHNYIKMVGDKQSRYKRISNWGIIHQNNDIILDPYNFTSRAFDNSIKLVKGYVQLLT